MSGIKPDQWSADNPFVDQQQPDSEQWSSDNPFIDQAPVTASAEAPPKPQPSDNRSSEALAAIGRGVKGAITGFIPGTIEFGKQVGRTALAGAKYYLDPASGVYKAVEEGKKLKEMAFDPVARAVTFPFDAQGLTHEQAMQRLEEFTGVASTFALGEAAHVGFSKLGKSPSGPVERIEARQRASETPPAEPVAPVEGVTDLSKAQTPEERAAIVEQMRAQGASVEKAQADAKGRLLKAVQTWNTLSTEQRGQVVPGLAVTDYTKTWKELGKEARAQVKKSLNLAEPESGTNLDTSQSPQASSSAPAAQGEGAPSELPSEPAGPSPSQPATAGSAPAAPEPGVVGSIEPRSASVGGEVIDTRASTERGVFSAAGKVLGEDVYDPATPGNPLIAKAGTRITPELLNRLKQAGIERVIAGEGGAGKVAGSIVPGSELIGKRFVNPEQPEYSAVITKNTKPGEKPYRVSYFKTDAEGKPIGYLHNAFDTPQEAYDWVTGKPDMAGDKLKGYKELAKDGSYEITPDEAVKQGLVKPEDVVRGQFLIDESKNLPPGGMNQVPDVRFFDLQTLRDELGRAEGKLSDLSIQESMGTDVTKRGVAAEREHWEKYAEDLKDEMARRLKRPDVKGVPQAIDQVPDIGPVEPTETSPIAVNDRVTTADGKAGKIESLQGGRAVVQFDDGDLVNISLAELNREVPRTQDPNAPNAPSPETPASTSPSETPPGAEGPIETSARDQLKLYTEYNNKVSQLHQDLVSKKIDKTEWRRRADELAAEKKALDEEFGNDEITRLTEDPLNYRGKESNAHPEDYPVDNVNESSGPTAEDIAREFPPGTFDPLRIEKIEQSIEDKTQVEKLLNEGPNGPYKGNSTDAFKGASPDQLDSLIDDADAALEAGEITPKEHERILFEVAEHKRAWKAQNQGPAPTTPTSKFKMPDTVGKDLNKFSNDQLKNTLKSIGAMLQSPDIRNLPEAAVLRQELDRILDYQDQIRKASEGGAGPGLSIKKIDVEGRPKYEQYFSKKIVTDAEFKQPFNMVKWLRQLYQGTTRPSHALNVSDRLYEGATGKQLETQHMAGRQMEMMDGTLVKAETFLRGDGPFVPDGQGGTVKTGARSLADIITNIAKGDVERLGWLWAARRALDLKALRNRNIGIDLGYAQELVVNSPQELHIAVDEARKYHSSLSLYAQIEGLISPEARTAFEQESSYGPIQRLYGPQQLVSKLSETINKSGRTAEQIMASDEFKRLRGSDLLIRNMVESTMDVTHRILRAAQLNRTALELVNKAIEQPELYKGMIDKFEHREHLQIMRDLTARASAVKAIFKEAGIDLSSEHANLFANILSDDALEMKGGKLLVWRDGKIEAWKVDELHTNALKSLTPQELPTWVRAMGVPARVARIGIVLDPAFMIGQLINDQFQGWFNTRYGFVPVVDAFRGWYNIVRNTDAFKEAQRAGGIEKAALRGKTTLADIMAGPALTPGELAFEQIKTMHPLKALNTIITPVREATRMGEYLKARGRGATPIEAAWAARDLLGNYSLQGTFATVRALNHMSMFLGPAIAVTDKTFRTIKERPGQWFSRATTLAGIATLLYLANKDDDEINQLRQTPGGQRWFFMRIPGTNEIIKMRKPYLEGAIFASGMEAVLDSYRQQNPEAFELWAKSLKQELALNMLPVMGVVPFQLWANKDYNSGASIIPESQTELDPQFQTGYYSGSAERIVGKATGISPAILSYVTRSTTGYLGESAVKGVSAAIDWANTGELPPKEDLPFTQRVFAKYPSYSVKPVQDFYNMADKIGRAANTIDFAANHSPDDLESVLVAHEKELPLIEMFNDSRQQIADLRKSIQDIEDIKDLGPQSKKQYTDEFLRAIIEIAGATVQAARQVQESQGQ